MRNIDSPASSQIFGALGFEGAEIASMLFEIVNTDSMSIKLKNNIRAEATALSSYFLQIHPDMVFSALDSGNASRINVIQSLMMNYARQKDPNPYDYVWDWVDERSSHARHAQIETLNYVYNITGANTASKRREVVRDLKRLTPAMPEFPVADGITTTSRTNRSA